MRVGGTFFWVEAWIAEGGDEGLHFPLTDQHKVDEEKAMMRDCGGCRRE